MAAGKLKITIEQGATYRRTLELKAGDLNAPAMDLTGYSARMQVRTDYDAPTPLLSLTIANGRITITPLTGRVDLYISATDTAALAFETAVYDLEIESAGGEVTRVLYGPVTLSPEVTK